jgi:signal transduction histidine kinase
MTDPWRARAERAEAHLAALDAAIRGISGVLTIDRVLQLIVDAVRELAGAQYAALGIADATGRIERFLTSGIGDRERERIGTLPQGRGLLGLIIKEGQSFRIADLATDPRRHGLPPHHPEMRAFLGVPVTFRGRPIGDLYLTNKQGAAEFSADDQLLVERFALHAGLAIQNARLSERVQALAVVEERERIGRDLHDDIIGRIYAVALSLDDIPEMMVSSPEAATARVDHAVEALNATIGEIRNFIFGLRPGAQDVGGLTAALETLADEIRMTAPVDVVVEADDLPVISDEIAEELLKVAREALSNASRHADANRVSVELRAEGGQVRLEIGDDGRGFDPDAPRSAEHRGLANMRRRAEQLHGRLEVASGAGLGTRIIVLLPLAR